MLFVNCCGAWDTVLACFKSMILIGCTSQEAMSAQLSACVQYAISLEVPLLLLVERT